MRIRIPTFLLLLTLVATQSLHAYDYEKAGKAAGKALDQHYPTTKFYFYNLPRRGGDPALVLRFMRDAKKTKTALAFGAPHLSYIEDLLIQTFKASAGEKFDGVVVVIVGPITDPKRFKELLEPRGFVVINTSYEE